MSVVTMTVENPNVTYFHLEDGNTATFEIYLTNLRMVIYLNFY